MRDCGATLRWRERVATAPADFAMRFPVTGGALYGRASHGWRASFQRPAARSRLPGLYLAGGSAHPGPGVPMAALSGRQAALAMISDLNARGPGSISPVAPGGYGWWYVDAFSDDGKHGLTIIAFLGSVFSPYYAWRGRRAPEEHCAINVALYGEPGRWAMTERGARALSRSSQHFAVGPSALRWDGGGLDIDIDEVCAPFPRRLSGKVRLDVETINRRVFELSSAGRHSWRPIAPLARVSVEMSRPAIRWRGHAYFDTNRGAEPLEAGFRAWHWSRARLSDRARIFYDAEKRRGGHTALSLEFDAHGGLVERPAPGFVSLPRTLWRLPRQARSAAPARVIATLEDAPFYTRSQIAHEIDGEQVVSVHESLDLNRFASPIVKAMLPFRMPRKSGPA